MLFYEQSSYTIGKSIGEKPHQLHKTLVINPLTFHRKPVTLRPVVVTFDQLHRLECKLILKHHCLDALAQKFVLFNNIRIDLLIVNKLLFTKLFSNTRTKLFTNVVKKISITKYQWW